MLKCKDLGVVQNLTKFVQILVTESLKILIIFIFIFKHWYFRNFDRI
jgi:hypothetical protein